MVRNHPQRSRNDLLARLLLSVFKLAQIHLGEVLGDVSKGRGSHVQLLTECWRGVSGQD